MHICFSYNYLLDKLYFNLVLVMFCFFILELIIKLNTGIIIDGMVNESN